MDRVLIRTDEAHKHAGPNNDNSRGNHREEERTTAQAARGSTTSYFQFLDCTGFILTSITQIWTLLKPQQPRDMTYHDSYALRLWNLICVQNLTLPLSRHLQATELLFSQSPIAIPSKEGNKTASHIWL